MTPWLVRELSKVGVSRGVHGRARCGGCGQEPASEIGQGGCLCAGRDAADWVVPRGVCKVARHYRLKATRGARDQLVRAKRALGNQVRGLLRPFGIRLPLRQGPKKFSEAAHQAVRRDNMLHASVTALLEALAAIEGQIARLDEQLKEVARRSPVCWRPMSVPAVGPIVALAFMAAIEDINRFRRMRRVGAYLGLTTRRYQSSEMDVVLGISRQGDAMARHYLYEAANVLLTTVRRSALKSWGLKLMKRRGTKRARVRGGAQARHSLGTDLKRYPRRSKRAIGGSS
jgi:transposase